MSFVDGFNDSQSSTKPKAAMAAPQSEQLPDPASGADDQAEDDDGRHNRHAAEERRRPLVPAVLLRRGDEPEAMGGDAADRRQDQR